MWVFSTTGFYSVVQKSPCKKDEVLVRTRCKEDIEFLAKALEEKHSFKGKILSTPRADYGFRMVVPKESWAAYLTNLVMDLDYGNFKDTIPENDSLRHAAYLTSWRAMFDFQRKKANQTF